MEKHLQAKENFKTKKAAIDDAPKVFSDLLAKKIIDYTEYRLLCLILNHKQKINKYNILRFMPSHHPKITSSLERLSNLNLVLIDVIKSNKKEISTYYINPSIELFWDLLINNKKATITN